MVESIELTHKVQFIIENPTNEFKFNIVVLFTGNAMSCIHFGLWMGVSVCVCACVWMCYLRRIFLTNENSSFHFQIETHLKLNEELFVLCSFLMR